MLVRFVFFTCQLLSTGAALVAVYAVPRDAAAPLRVGAHRVVAAWGLLQVPATLLELTQPSAPSRPVLVGALSLLLGAASLALALSAGERAGDRLLRLVAAGSLIAIATPAAPTELRGLSLQAALDPIFTQAHVLGGSLWVGGLALAGLLVLGERGGPGSRPGFWPDFWTAFSRVATWGLGVVAVSGLWLAWVRVGSPDELLGTSYGRTLIVKLSLVGVMASLGAINQLVLIPGIARARAAGDERSVARIAVHDLRIAVVAEALLGVGVIAVVPFLTGSAREQAAAASGAPYAPAVLDVEAAAIGLAGGSVMVLLLWAATRVSARLSQSGSSQVP